MKLELKHIAPYLPYGLKVIWNNNIEHPADLITLMYHYEQAELRWEYGQSRKELSDIKPILRPLSDLTKEIEHNGEKFVPTAHYGLELHDGEWCEVYHNGYGEHSLYIPVETMNLWLFELHFDVFGLIDQGLAIDLNTIK